MNAVLLEFLLCSSENASGLSKYIVVDFFSSVAVTWILHFLMISALPVSVPLRPSLVSITKLLYERQVSNQSTFW